MAVTTTLERAEDRDANDELTDQQIEELLTQATARLQAKAVSSAVARPSEQQRYKFPKLETGKLDKPYISTENNVAILDKSVLRSEQMREQSKGIRRVEDPALLKKAVEEKKKATAGSSWYDLPATNLTPELKRDLQLLNMRNVLDPKRHYKKGPSKLGAPKYMQVGTIVEGPTEWYSDRIDNKQRKRTFVEEVMAGEHETKRFKRKYGELQTKHTSGKKAFYKSLKAQRKGGVKKGG